MVHEVSLHFRFFRCIIVVGNAAAAAAMVVMMVVEVVVVVIVGRAGRVEAVAAMDAAIGTAVVAALEAIS